MVTRALNGDFCRLDSTAGVEFVCLIELELQINWPSILDMANPEHLKIVQQQIEASSLWKHPFPAVKLVNIEMDLSGADFRGSCLAWAIFTGANFRATDFQKANLDGTDLSGADLNDANLSGASLRGANLSNAKLSRANLNEADLRGANLRGANLIHANLNEANLSRADLSSTNINSASLRNANLSGIDLSASDLTDADLRGAEILRVNFSGARLNGVDLTEAIIWNTIFSDIDLSTVKGLDTVIHWGPSTIGVDTLYRSQGEIPEPFLRGSGLTEEFISFLPAFIESLQPIQFHSSFISHSHRDEAFATRLYSAMRGKNLRVWYAPEDMKGGRKLHEEIFRAIQVYDKLLLVLSENSIRSEWVMTEIRRARKVEREENRRKLFPIRLVDFETIQKWECFDSDSGKDLAIELREYYIPDFSNWKDHDSFESEFGKLLRDLRASENRVF